MGKQSLIEKVATKDAMEFNAIASDSLKLYKEVRELLDETYFVLGKGNTFKATTASTSTLEINCHAQFSTTSQEI